FNGLEDPLLVNYRSENNGYPFVLAQSLSYLFFDFIHGLMVFVYQIPFVDHDHYPFVVFDGDRDKIDVLGFQASCRIHHNNNDIRFFERPQRTHYRIKFDVFFYLRFFTNTSRVGDNKILSKKLVTGMDGIPCGSRNIGYNGSLRSQQSVYKGGLADIGSSKYGYLGNSEIRIFYSFLLKILNDLIQQIARAA